MTTLPRPLTPANASAFLPKTIAIASRIEAHLQSCRRLDHALNGNYADYTVGRGWTKQELAEAKQLLAEREAMRRDWAMVSQPATRELIAVAVGRTLASFPNLNKAETKYFAQILCEEIGSEQPSVYVLVRTVRMVGRHREFVSEAAMFAELAKARRAAQRHELKLTGTELEDNIACAETRLPERRKAKMERP